MEEDGVLQEHRFVPVAPIKHDVDAQKSAFMARIKARAAKRKLEAQNEIDQTRVQPTIEEKIKDAKIEQDSAKSEAKQSGIEPMEQDAPEVEQI